MLWTSPRICSLWSFIPWIIWHVTLWPYLFLPWIPWMVIVGSMNSMNSHCWFHEFHEWSLLLPRIPWKVRVLCIVATNSKSLRTPLSNCSVNSMALRTPLIKLSMNSKSQRTPLSKPSMNGHFLPPPPTHPTHPLPGKIRDALNYFAAPKPQPFHHTYLISIDTTAIEQRRSHDCSFTPDFHWWMQQIVEVR